MATAPKQHKPPGTRQKRDYRAIDRHRGNPHQRGYTSKWARYSEIFRAGLCEECDRAGRTTPAVCTDHIVPVTGPDDPLFWEESNHQRLCQSCHSRKTATEVNGRQIR